MALTLNGTSGIVGAGIGTIGPSGANVTGVVTCTSVVSSGAISGTTGTFTGALSGTTGTLSGKLRVDISSTGTAGSGSAEGIFLRNTNETDNNAVTIFGGADSYAAAASAINFINVDHSANAGDISFDTRTTGNSYAERFRIASDGDIEVKTGDVDIETSGKGIQFPNSYLTESASNMHLNIAAGNNDFYIQSGGTTFAAFKGSAKDLQVTSGNLVIGTAGKGIDFSATAGPTQGSGTSELLDDYEEGTWTPTLGGISQNPTSIGYANQNGLYRKIGNQVTVWMRIRVNAITMGSASGTGIIMGLPFNNAGTDAYEGATVGWNYYTNWNGLSNKSPSGYMSGSQNYIRITLIGEGANSTNWQITDCTSNLNIYGNMTYITS